MVIMIWRKFKLEWSYAVGELLIVVIGVLIALAIDQWNDERLERLEEVDAVARILADLHNDLRSFEFRLKAVDEKENSLLRVKAFLAGAAQIDPVIFLADVVIGANFGWHQSSAQRSAYDNLVESGNLGIIANPNIGFEISNYYRYYIDSHDRIDARETDYPEISYHLVPRQIRISKNGGNVGEREIKSGLSDRKMNELVELIQASSIGEQITAELNLAQFIRGTELSLQERASSLIILLEEYQASL